MIEQFKMCTISIYKKLKRDNKNGKYRYFNIEIK